MNTRKVSFNIRQPHTNNEKCSIKIYSYFVSIFD